MGIFKGFKRKIPRSENSRKPKVAPKADQPSFERPPVSIRFAKKIKGPQARPSKQPKPALFPWAKEAKTYNRKKFSLICYQDGSRLYLFRAGGFLVLTPEGVTILKRDKQMLKRYWLGKKFFLTSGGNSNIFVIKSGEIPLIAKEHLRGLSAKGQLDHMAGIRNNLLNSKSIHEVPEYYAVASFPPGERIRDLSVMEFMKGKKVLSLKEELKAKKDAQSKKMLKQLESEYADFEKRIKKRRITLTDVHEGNILTYYAPSRRRFIFIVIDQ